MFYFLLLPLIVQEGSAAIFQSKIDVIEGGSFVQYLVDTSDILFCNLTSRRGPKDVRIGLDPQLKNITVYSKFEDPKNLSTRISSLGSGYCGFKLVNLQDDDPISWKLTAENSSMESMEESFDVLRFYLGKTHTKKAVTVGMITSIECGRPITQSQHFCQIYNPNGELKEESERCSLLISSVSMSDFGRWRCVSGMPQSMDALEYIVELVDEGLPDNEGWVEETDDYYKIGCKITSRSIPTFCRIVEPTGKVYVITSGLATERLTSLHTNLKNRICGIEITKPLLQHENGFWKCIMNDRGSVLNVGNVTDLQYNEHLPLEVEEFKKLKIMCQVPYSAKACYIISANGDRIKPDVPSRSQLGECSYTISSANREHNGMWSCFFIKNKDVHAEVIKVEVKVRKSVICTDEIHATQGASVELSCKTNSVNVQYCYFVSPNGETYHMFNDYSSEKLAYSGSGLEYGDCGIVLFNVEENQFGNWSCIFRKTSDFKEDEIVHLVKLTQIKNLDIAEASSLGIFVGIILIAVVVVTLAKRRRNKKNEENSPAGDMQELTEMHQPLNNDQHYL